MKLRILTISALITVANIAMAAPQKTILEKVTTDLQNGTGGQTCTVKIGQANDQDFVFESTVEIWSSIGIGGYKSVRSVQIDKDTVELMIPEALNTPVNAKGSGPAAVQYKIAANGNFHLFAARGPELNVTTPSVAARGLEMLLDQVCR
jgi:hypothetical protein